MTATRPNWYADMRRKYPDGVYYTRNFGPSATGRRGWIGIHPLRDETVYLPHAHGRREARKVLARHLAGEQ